MYTTGAEWKTAFGSMDRRSLYAVASNEGGLFTADEQGAARYIMNTQMQAAMGLQDSMPVADPAASYKAAIDYLDSASPEEKASFEWAKERAASQYGYESAMRRDGLQPENVDSDDPVVKLIKSAMDALQALGDPSKQLEDMPQYKQAQALFASRTNGTNGASSTLVDVTA